MAEQAWSPGTQRITKQQDLDVHSVKDTVIWTSDEVIKSALFFSANGEPNGISHTASPR